MPKSASPKPKGKIRKKSTSPKPKSGSSSSSSSKELKELKEAFELLKTENEKLQTNYKRLCESILRSINIEDYAYYDPETVQEDATKIEINDLENMINRLSLLATEVSATERSTDVHRLGALEYRITELSNEKSSFFKDKLKLQQRLEFILQERDVWKRNAETLKKMYAKLGNKFFHFYEY
jgi:chromosome segregation ATPase